MTALKDQLEALSAEHVEGIVLSHPGEPHVSMPDRPEATIIDLSKERQRRRGRYVLTAVAAAFVLVGFLVFTNSGDDNSAPSPVATEGSLSGPVLGPNGEDLGIWSDAILALGPQGFADRAQQLEQSIVRSLPEINECLESMDNEPYEPSASVDSDDPAPIAGERAFAETEGFGFASLHGFPFGPDVDVCYYGRTVDGTNGPDAWANEESVATTSLLHLVQVVTPRPFDPEIGAAGQLEVLISEDPAIKDNEGEWSSCMEDRGYDYESEVRARADVSRRFGELAEANRAVFAGPDFIDTPEFAAMKAEEIEVATASWDCGGGDAGEILRENARQRALAEFVVMYRDDLEVQYGNDLFTACQSAQALVVDESADIQARGEARMERLKCEQ